MTPLRVGVVFGGRSVEHDVSIVTGHQVMEALAGRHEVVPIYVTRQGRWLTGPGLNDIEAFRRGEAEGRGDEAWLVPVPGAGLVMPGTRLRGPRPVAVDVVIPAIHGTYGEDGTVQGALELAGLPYAGSGVAASAVGMDKDLMKAVFRAADLPVLDHVLIETERLAAAREEVLDELERRIGYPAFVKPCRVGSSVGIGKARTREELSEALEVAAAYDRRVLVEPALEGTIEVNCSVLGGAGRAPRASVLEQPLPRTEALTFADKYLRGGKEQAVSGSKGMADLARKLPAELADDLAERVRANALRAFAAIDASGVARVDAFVRKDTGETWVMEINTTPGSFAFYLWEATGLAFPDLVEELIDIAMTAHRSRSERLYTFDSGLLASAQGVKAGG